MDDKGIQVSIGSKRKKTMSAGRQTTLQTPKEERATQCGIPFKGRYGSNRKRNKWRYDNLVARMQDKEMLVHWLMNEGLMVKERSCPMCAGEMSLTRCQDRSVGFKWECTNNIIIYRFLERHILKALWRFTILKINTLTNQKTIKSLSKKKGLEAPFECV